MRVHRSLESLPSIKNAVVTIGTFDGVHTGHRKIISQLRREAAACGGETVIITFDPHPRKVLGGAGAPLQLLTTLEEKIYLLDTRQVDHLVIVPFTRAFSRMPATDYVRDFLVGAFHPHTIIIGHDHHFGHNREGNISLLRSLEARYGFRVLEIPAEVVDDVAVSSTAIRSHLKEGQIEKANALLGYPYFISAPVVRGDRRGRTLGFPTANLGLQETEKLIPAEGIYAARVTIAASAGAEKPQGVLSLDGVASIGTNPTFGGGQLRVEVHIFHFNRDIYGQPVRLSLYAYIRPNRTFKDAAALVGQMQEDALEAERILAASPDRQAPC